MDEGLKEQLREFGLLPLSLDEKAQKCYEDMYEKLGLPFDPSQMESYPAPGTPKDIIKKQEAIQDNVVKLHNMEVSGYSDSPTYSIIEGWIREDLAYLKKNQEEGNVLIPTGYSAKKDVVIPTPKEFSKEKRINLIFLV